MPWNKPDLIKNWSWTDRGMLLNAWVLWAILLVVVCGIIAASPDPLGKKSVTGNYRLACEKWWDRQPLYRLESAKDIDGFLYFPQAAILHTPFSFGPVVLGEVLWRAFILGVFVAGLWRLSKLVRPDHTPGYFAVISFLSIFSVAGNLRNGQSNLLMAGTMMLAAAELADKNWWRATFWLVLGLAFKPLVAVMLLLVGALYFRQMSWRLVAGLAALAVLPFLTAPAGYVLSQHTEFLEKMRAATAPDRTFADLKGLLDSAGLKLGEKPLMLIRLAFAPITLGLVWLAFKRFGKNTGALALLSGAVIYLMIFNPRTEGLGYVALAPVMAVFFCWAVWEKRNLPAAICLAAACALFGLEYELIGKHLQTGGWLKPLMCAAFTGYLIYLLTSGKHPAPGIDREEQPVRELSAAQPSDMPK